MNASVTALINGIVAGTVGPANGQSAIDLAGGRDFVMLEVIRALAAGSGGGTWGGITGTLANQTDLAAAIAAAPGTVQVQSDWNATTGLGAVLNKPTNLIGGSSGNTDKVLLMSNGAGGATAQASGLMNPSLSVLTANDGTGYTGSLKFGGGMVFFGRKDEGYFVQAGDDGVGGLGLIVGGDAKLGFCLNPSSQFGQNAVTTDAFFMRTGAASIRMGNNSATPVAQTFGAANGVGSNITGAPLTLNAGNGTGTGGSGALNFATAAPGTTGSAANTQTTRLQIDQLGFLLLKECSTIPAGNPTAGCYLYVDPADHKLKAKGSSGTVTILALP